MDCHTLMGVAKSTGLEVSMTFDPYTEAPGAWVIHIGEHVEGRGPTPEQALDQAIAALEAREQEATPLG